MSNNGILNPASSKSKSYFVKISISLAYAFVRCCLSMNTSLCLLYVLSQYMIKARIGKNNSKANSKSSSLNFIYVVLIHSSII